MKKYIDRDALVEYAHCQYGILTPNDIMEFPTADVQPVNGWISEKDRLPEYISKQSVIDYLKGYLNSIGECGADSLLFDRGQRRALINSIQDISAIKGADVQPVRYGKWVKSNTQRHVEITYECSECQHEVVGEYEKTPFCGGCGARMDGDSDD